MENSQGAISRTAVRILENINRIKIEMITFLDPLPIPLLIRPNSTAMAAIPVMVAKMEAKIFNLDKIGLPFLRVRYT